jgi:hypothetical protein
MTDEWTTLYKYERLILKNIACFNDEFVQDLNAIMGLDVFREAMWIFFEENSSRPVDTQLNIVYDQVREELRELAGARRW